MTTADKSVFFEKLEGRVCDAYIRAICWQDIVDRKGVIIGCEGLIRFPAVSDCDTKRVVSDLPFELLNITSELLFRISLSCILLSYQSNKSRLPLKLFLNIERQMLSKPDSIDELIEASLCLKMAGYELVVEVSAQPLSNASSFRMYIDGLIRLKQAGVFVVLDNYSISNEGHVELELGLVDLVKFDLRSLAIPLAPSSVFFTRVHEEVREALAEFIRLYRLPLLAKRVETLWQFGVVSGLPFSYFQGYHFGRLRPAEDELIPVVKDGGCRS